MPPPGAGSSHLPPASSRRAALVFTCLPLWSLLPNLSSPCPLPHSPLLPSYSPLNAAHAALAHPLQFLLLHKFCLCFPPSLCCSCLSCLLLPLLLSLLARSPIPPPAAANSPLAPYPPHQTLTHLPPNPCLISCPLRLVLRVLCCPPCCHCCILCCPTRRTKNWLSCAMNKSLFAVSSYTRSDANR